jgi:hypothetical protein
MPPLVEGGSNPVVRQGDRRGLLSGRARSTALTFTALGLLTFFVPLIRFDPPALGKQQWSVLDIALVLQARLRPETLFPLLRIPFVLIYLLLFLALGSLCVRFGNCSCGLA